MVDAAPPAAFEDRVGDREHVFRVLTLLSETDREVLLLTGRLGLVRGGSGVRGGRAARAVRAVQAVRLGRARRGSSG
ncbi:hypothetical protein ACFV1L_00990 [Kitasatospora sp. NPDC059646]|uniref:hypothetical protein n=1 Tax=Kitasatospora sp. NPDC059646 TaxID=3346893 RepID=UPI0036A21581